MRPLESTALPPFHFEPERGQTSHKFRAIGNKIAWLRLLCDEPGAKFDLVIKDGLGRVRATKRGCHATTGEFGELVNMETFLGEEMEVLLENVSGAKTIDLFLN